MSKGEEKTALGNVRNERNQSNQIFGSLYGPMSAERDAAQKRSLTDRESIRSGYQGFANTGGLDPTVMANLRRNSYANGTDATGGFAGSGGISVPTIDRSGYEEFAKTGGYSQGDISNIRSRSTSGIPALYATNRDESARRAAIQGGYQPGYAASMAKMQRGAGQGLTDATRNAEVDLAAQVRSGRQYGVSGLADIDKYSAGLGLQAGQYNSDLDLRNRAFAAGNEQWIGEGIQRGQLSGLAGLTSLQGTTPAELAMYNDDLINLYGMRGNLNNQNLGLESDLSKSKGFWGSLGDFGMAGGSAFASMAPYMFKPNPNLPTGGGSPGGTDANGNPISFPGGDPFNETDHYKPKDVPKGRR